MEYFTAINANGRAGLIAFIEDRARDGALWADRMADALIAEHDGSYPEAHQIVELSGLKTKSGNPETYCFGVDEFDVLPVDDLYLATTVRLCR
jgi:hypothetical protein